MSIKNIELHLGDCLKVMKSIPNGSVDLILCDLPYGTTRNKWDSITILMRFGRTTGECSNLTGQ